LSTASPPGQGGGRKKKLTSGEFFTGENHGLPHEGMARAMVALSRLATRDDSLAEVQRAQLTVVYGLTQPRSCFLLEHRPGEAELRVVSVRGRNDERIAATRPGEGPEGKAFSSQNVVRETGLVAVPVLGSEGALGCMVVLGPRVELPDELWLALGAQLGAAWAFCGLRDDSALRSKDLQTAVEGLKALEKNREELLSNVSHDLKNPLSTLKTYLGMLVQGKLGELSEAQRNALSVMERNADRLHKMISDLLLVSRLRSEKIELDQRPFGIKAVLAEAMSGLAARADRAKVTLDLQRSPEVFVQGNRERLLEALQHLVEYALHQSSGGGVVHLGIEVDGALARLWVTHAGEHSPPELVRHLFESFRHARGPKGVRTAEVALSLPIVARLIQLHGGRVESAVVPEGTRLSILLPAFAAAVAPLSAAGVARLGDILLVEDDGDCREVVRDVLEAEGYSVVAVGKSQEAKAFLASCRPALVLLDLRLSHEDGLGVLHHIRETPGLTDVPVYLVSGASEVSSLTAGTGKDRIDGYLEKPLQLQRLLDTVAQVVHPLAQ
jgi:signal transduction histidine kinase/CheY-like chemotaxis protein